jgi:hypothetical protein
MSRPRALPSFRAVGKLMGYGLPQAVGNEAAEAGGGIVGALCVKGRGGGGFFLAAAEFPPAWDEPCAGEKKQGERFSPASLEHLFLQKASRLMPQLTQCVTSGLGVQRAVED